MLEARLEYKALRGLRKACDWDLFSADFIIPNFCNEKTRYIEVKWITENNPSGLFSVNSSTLKRSPSRPHRMNDVDELAFDGAHDREVVLAFRDFLLEIGFECCISPSCNECTIEQHV